LPPATGSGAGVRRGSGTDAWRAIAIVLLVLVLVLLRATASRRRARSARPEALLIPPASALLFGGKRRGNE
jgi:hypothetical protein